MNFESREYPYPSTIRASVKLDRSSSLLLGGLRSGSEAEFQDSGSGHQGRNSTVPTPTAMEDRGSDARARNEKGSVRKPASLAARHSGTINQAKHSTAATPVPDLADQAILQAVLSSATSAGLSCLAKRQAETLGAFFVNASSRYSKTRQLSRVQDCHLAGRENQAES